jgi:precorrin-2 dehydrogenase / sirohydrochlorin ferrochelatase
MSAYPLMLEGSAISAVVVGGGRVAARKTRALLETGATVHVVARDVAPEMQTVADGNAALTVTRASYAPAHLGDALLVIAATDDAETNACVAADARALGRLVNVAGAPELGNCVMPAVHRAGDVVVSVTAGRLPGAAARIRDTIGRAIDDRYGDAVRELSSLRRRALDEGKGRWTEASAALIGPDFCEQVETGSLPSRIAEWR